MSCGVGSGLGLELTWHSRRKESGYTSQKEEGVAQDPNLKRVTGSKSFSSSSPSSVSVPPSTEAPSSLASVENVTCACEQGEVAHCLCTATPQRCQTTALVWICVADTLQARSKQAASTSKRTRQSVLPAGMAGT